MKEYCFAISENNFMTYFCKEKTIYFILIKSDIRDVAEKSYEFAHPHKRNINSETEKLLKSNYFGLIRRGADEKLSRHFIDNYLQSNLYLKNSSVSIENFGAVSLKHECELLIDLLYCICQNNKNISAEINYKAATNTATLQMLKKSSVSYGMRFDSKIPLEQLESYVSNHLGIVMRLKSGDYIKYGSGIDERNFDSLIKLNKINIERLLFN
jgi:hypothetical protein